MVVLIGATPEGKKELIGVQVDVRENVQSWRELLIGMCCNAFVSRECQGHAPRISEDCNNGSSIVSRLDDMGDETSVCASGLRALPLVRLLLAQLNHAPRW